MSEKQVTELKLRRKEEIDLKLDKEMQQLNQASKLSIYGKDFPNYGKIEKKLVFRRPEEKYYPMPFIGKQKSKYTLENDRTNTIIEETNKAKVNTFLEDQVARIEENQRKKLKQKQLQQKDAKYNTFFLQTTKMKDNFDIQNSVKNKEFVKMKQVYRGTPVRDTNDFLEASNFNIDQIIQEKKDRRIRMEAQIKENAKRLQKLVEQGGNYSDL